MLDNDQLEEQFTIDHIIDHHLLQRLLDSFSTVSHLRVAVTDVDGKPLTVSREGDCDFCRLVKSCPEGREQCWGSYARAGQEAAKWNEPYFFRCHAGLISWACPIMYSNRHIGNMICGQVLIWEPEDFFWKEVKELTQSLAVDNSKLMETARHLEVVSATEAQAAADLIFIIANHLAQSGTDLNYQVKLRNIRSWLWINYKQKQPKGKKKEGQDNIFLDLQQQIFEEIRNSNTDKAKTLFDKLALHFFTQSKGQIEVIKGLSFEFIISLARLATEYGVKFDESFKTGMHRFQELENVDTVEQVFLWLLTIGNYYLEKLTSRDEDTGDLAINKAISYIEEKYSRHDLSIEEVAQNAYTNPAYLSRLFKKKTGATMVEYIRQTRIKHAKRLLQLRDKNTSDVAQEVGYRDRSYFCKVFKQTVGLTPNEYRHKHFLS